MAQPWKMLIDPDQIDIVAPDGTVRCSVLGYYSGTEFVLDDPKADVEVGDEIRRPLPNGKEEVFRVVNPVFHNDKSGRMFGSHWQVKVAKDGNFPRHKGGNYNINLHGTNARVNINSTDNSVNTSIEESPFTSIKSAIQHGVPDQAEKSELLSRIAKLEKAKEQGSFTKAYQQLIGSAANHMTILAPFLPALTQMMTQLPR